MAYNFDLPKTLVVGEKEYDIAYDWRTWANITRAAMSHKSNAEKVADMLLLCYGKKMPPSLKEACKQMMRFYSRGKESSESDGDSRRAFDLIHDFGLVSAAFMSRYGIDLRETKLHWWQFWELFDGLGEDEKIIKVIGWRAAKPGQIKNKEERKFIRKMQELYALPDERSEAEKDAAMIRVLESVM